MKIMIKDLCFLGIIGFVWLLMLKYFQSSGNKPAVEALYGFPGHLLITVGYYAVCNVCYSILFISDCVNEHQELMDDIQEGRMFFENKHIKYN